MKQWVIIGPSGDTLDDAGREVQEEVLYWSNEIGWVGDVQSATVFSDEEKPFCTLPMPGAVWLDVTKELR